ASGRRCSPACHSSHSACSSSLPFSPAGRTDGSHPGSGSRAAEREAASRRTSTRGASATLGETAGAVDAAVARSSALGPAGRVSGSKGDCEPRPSSAPAESGIAMVAAARVPRTATRGTRRCWLATCEWGRGRREVRRQAEAVVGPGGESHLDGRDGRGPEDGDARHPALLAGDLCLEAATAGALLRLAPGTSGLECGGAGLLRLHPPPASPPF